MSYVILSYVDKCSARIRLSKLLPTSSYLMTHEPSAERVPPVQPHFKFEVSLKWRQPVREKKLSYHSDKCLSVAREKGLRPYKVASYRERVDNNIFPIGHASTSHRTRQRDTPVVAHRVASVQWSRGTASAFHRVPQRLCKRVSKSTQKMRQLLICVSSKTSRDREITQQNFSEPFLNAVMSNLWWCKFALTSNILQASSSN